MLEVLLHVFAEHRVVTVTVSADAPLPVNDVVSCVLDNDSRIAALRPVTPPGVEPCLQNVSPDGERGEWIPLASVVEPWSRWATRGSVLFVSFTGPIPPIAPVGHTAQPRVEVLTGPDSGFALTGTHSAWTVGRSDAAAVCLADPFLTRSPVDLPRTASPTLLGSTCLRWTSHAARDTVLRTPELPRLGRLRPPKTPSWLLFLIPLIAGVVLAVALQMWFFLIFSVMGPLSAGLAWLLERRRFRADARREVADLRVRLAAYSAQLTELRLEYAGDRLQVETRPGWVTVGRGGTALPVEVESPPAVDAELPEAVRNLVAGYYELHRPAARHIDGRDWLVCDQSSVRVDLQAAAVRASGDSAVVQDVMRSAVLSLLTQNCTVMFHCPAPREFTDVPIGVCPCVHGDDCSRGDQRSDPRTSGVQVHVWQVNGDTVMGHTNSPAGEDWLLRCRPNGVAELQGGPRMIPLSDPVPLGGSVSLRRLRPERFVAACPRWKQPAGVALTPRALEDAVDEVPAVVPGQPRLRVPVGENPTGTVCLDLIRDGPHALVAGTTGSGKSVLLQTWLVSLCAHNRPEHLRLILIDFKGGAAFSRLGALPHTDSVTSNLTRAQAARSLTSVRAEVVRREALLSESNSADVREHNAKSAEPLPLIVVVIDEFQELVMDNPAGTETLEALTALGRSLGIHVILTTQRPAGLVTARMKSNIALRIALRVRDAIDSLDVIDSEDAAFLSSEHPGLAIASVGSKRTEFRTLPALLETRAPSPMVIEWRHPAPPISALSGGGTGPLFAHRIPTQRKNPQLIPLLDRLRGAPPSTVRTIVTPGLPTRVRDAGAGAVGIIDFPSLCETAPWTPGPHDGNVLICGGPRTGKTSALAALTRARVHAGQRVIALCSDGSGVPAHHLVPHNQLWLIEYLLSRLETWPRENPVHLAIDDYDALLGMLTSPRRALRLERILAEPRSKQFSFSAVTPRSTFHSAIGSRAATRIVFAPPDAHDAVFFGLHPDRFAHAVPGRAVVMGPAAEAGGESGADVQFVLPEHPVVSAPPPWEPADCGEIGNDTSTAVAGAVDVPPLTTATDPPSGLLLGHGPWGEPIVWDPSVEGPVLTVRGPQANETAQNIALRAGRSCADAAWAQDSSSALDRGMCAPGRGAYASSGGVRASIGGACTPGDRVFDVGVVPDAQTANHFDIDAALERPWAILAMPFGSQPGYGSALARACDLGPSLLVGARFEGELAEAGHRDLPMCPADFAWFVTGQTATPVRFEHP